VGLAVQKGRDALGRSRGDRVEVEAVRSGCLDPAGHSEFDTELAFEVRLTLGQEGGRPPPARFSGSLLSCGSDEGQVGAQFGSSCPGDP
jgi:hypothetical protein